MGFPPHSNRSVMPLDVLHARYTDAFNEFITLPEKVRQSAMCVHRDGDRLLQLCCTIRAETNSNDFGGFWN